MINSLWTFIIVIVAATVTIIVVFTTIIINYKRQHLDGATVVRVLHTCLKLGKHWLRRMSLAVTRTNHRNSYK